MSQLNPQQLKAVRHIDGPLLVLAGAGSGKTSVITQKIAWLINDKGFPADSIYAVTFTNKAAREMRERVTRLLGKEGSEGLHVSTFHSLGLRIIREDAETLGYKKNFSILDSDDCANIVRDILRNDLSGDKSLPDQVRWHISSWKNELVSPDDAINHCDAQPVKSLAARVYPLYQQQLQAFNALDFDDLILLPVRLFNEHPEHLNKWRRRIRYLLVDEYQDTNSCQYSLVQQLVSAHHGLTVVGDDDQSIYTWRGARPENLALLNEDFNNLTVIKLEQNYRSSGRVLKAANAVIANNTHVFEKRLWSELGYGDPIRILPADNEEREAELVIADIQAQLFQKKLRYNDFAILYRSNHQSRVLEKVLRERGIPYYLSGGTSFFDRAEIKDLVAYLRLISNPDDDAAFLRCVETPKRHIGPATLSKLGHYAGSRHVSLLRACSELGLEQVLQSNAIARLRHFSDWIGELANDAMMESDDDDVDANAGQVFDRLLKDIDYENWLRELHKDSKAVKRRMENVNELRDWIHNMCAGDKNPSLRRVVANLVLRDMLDRSDDDAADNQVALMTLHAAKGLEFPHVYMIGMEENILPHHNSLDEAGITEERRLTYVGITRAQKTLTMTYARKRKRGPDRIDCEPSRFLEELPREDLHWSGRDELPAEEKQARGLAHLDGLRNMLEGG
ncbi:MAG: UvrD-helicase domain-containing protein [Gammaproteobacteria bacterium]|nr:UvrD-helicase domain-containing protein [Gammaproteobacteria bacterium]